MAGRAGLKSLCESRDLSRRSMTTGLEMKDFGAHRAPLQRVILSFSHRL